MKIKNWDRFQHFKDRNPPWIKLYRDLLDDEEWFSLPPESAKILVLLWLLASEDDTKQGLLPPLKKISFRCRLTENALQSIISTLSHWVIQDDIKMISPRHQHGPSETETETETETDICAKTDSRSIEDWFEEWWKAMPARGGRRLYKAQAADFYTRYVKPEERDSALTSAKAYATYCQKQERTPVDPHRFLFGQKKELWREFIPAIPTPKAPSPKVEVSPQEFVPPPVGLMDRLRKLTGERNPTNGFTRLIEQELPDPALND